MDYDELPTERIGQRQPLDALGIEELVALLHDHDRQAIDSLKQAQPTIAQAVRLAEQAFQSGGRLIYVGAGSSGRLGVLDAAECPPTFSAAPEQVVGVLAGGDTAFRTAAEGAEDRGADGVQAMEELGVEPKDFVLGISASGSARFVQAALERAHQKGASTGLLSCTSAVDYPWLDLLISFDPGPEPIAGSTRMKAGLATKAVLHTISTAAMVRRGKVYDNLMVDVRPTNRKLRQRAIRIVSELTGLATDAARELLRQAQDSPKVATVMYHLGCSQEQANESLRKHGGQLRRIIGDR